MWRRVSASYRSTNGYKMRVLLLSILLFVTTKAYAYIDPGTGSTIVSAIVGLFVAIGVAVKTYWYKLKGLFKTQESTAQEAPLEPAVKSDDSPAS